MGGIFGGGKSPKIVVPPTPQREDPAVEEARRAALLAAQRQRGRASTILTSGLGVLSEATTGRKTLLGQ